jgi:hypothetical protein
VVFFNYAFYSTPYEVYIEGAAATHVVTRLPRFLAGDIKRYISYKIVNSSQATVKMSIFGLFVLVAFSTHTVFSLPGNTMVSDG